MAYEAAPVKCIQNEGNPTYIAAKFFSTAEPSKTWSVISTTRSLRSSAATMLSASAWKTWAEMRRGKAGQTSIMSPGVSVNFSVQKSHRLRRCGDTKTMLCHRRHTCISACHALATAHPSQTAVVAGFCIKEHTSNSVG